MIWSPMTSRKPSSGRPRGGDGAAPRTCAPHCAGRPGPSARPCRPALRHRQGQRAARIHGARPNWRKRRCCPSRRSLRTGCRLPSASPSGAAARRAPAPPPVPPRRPGTNLGPATPTPFPHPETRHDPSTSRTNSTAAPGTASADLPALDLHPVAGRIGAEIRGVRPGADLDAGTFAAIRAALLRHKVLFFRDQQHLDDASRSLRQALRRPVAHPPCRSATARSSCSNSTRATAAAPTRHTDVTFDVAYPQVSVLRGVTIPAAGGAPSGPIPRPPTSTCPSLRQLADKLWALHTNDYDYAASRTLVHNDEACAATARSSPRPCTRPSIRWYACTRDR